MKSIFFVTLLCLIGLIAHAQVDSWKVKLNGKTLLVADKADPVQNIKKIKLTEWKKSGNLEIIFLNLYKSTGIRGVYFTDELENEVWRKDSASSVSISLSTLRKLLAGKKEVRIYSVISPSNPLMGMPTRIVHLCTLKLP